MALPVPVIIDTFQGDGTGSAYRVATDQILVADAGGGACIRAVTAHTHVASILGTGFGGPSDIVLSQDGLHAYVADRPGNLLKLPLSNLNRSAATVIASGMSNMEQIALDETHGYAYLANSVGITKVVLAGGAQTVAASVADARGVLITTDGRFLYVSSDNGSIYRFDLVAGTNTVVASGLGGPRYLTWADAGQSAILFPANGSSEVMKLDLSATPPAVSAITAAAPFLPYSVCVTSPNQIFITSGGAVSEVDLTSSLIGAGGPLLLGIGFVPADTVHLPAGFADTTMDPTYFFQVKDCPFGGTLPILINWDTAQSAGASFYQVTIANSGGAPVLVTQPYTDYLWSPTLNQFEAVTTVPVNGFYPVRQAGQIWLNAWLGLLFDSTGQQNNLNTITVKLYSAQSLSTQVGPTGSAGVMIDNTQPTAAIETILQQPGNVPINTCAIVTTGQPTFTFQITASAPAHLLSWGLSAGWGNNQSKAVCSDTYANHASPSFIWTGISNAIVPPPGPTPWNATVAGDPTSTHCAHSFYLAVYDRVINGWGYVHGPATYSKYITIML